MTSLLYLGLLILSLIWGASFFFIKVLLSFYNPLAIVFFRSLFGIVIILSIMLFTHKPLLPPRKVWKVLILIGVINSVIPWSLIGYSEKEISSSLASILNATTPIWTFIIGVLLFSSKVSKIQIIGVITGFLGIFILLDIDLSQLAISNFYGFMGMILAAIFYGFSSQISRKYFKEISTFQISLYTLLTSALFSGIIIIFTDSFHWTILLTEPKVLLSFLGLGSLGTGLALIIYYYLIQNGGAEFASLVTYLVPVTALFWGALLLNEEIKPSMLIGLLLILIGVYISGKNKTKEPKKLMKSNFTTTD
ncbi:hypothetical protein BHF71_07680 [Vulcanibacillus modesticaldus]|uniref:EamA domain-containing protein n=1 Tax=Vulcanibacillus modesticaldus TaxID=337097 RepID=A0A1D2YVF3_9BACI|nr:DMT family transporter [Vulcanibacillus modesticaldus]OEF99700.1 hypothetical protein BHF71_07680 [Vulcanibacillus modesticaldus]